MFRTIKSNIQTKQPTQREKLPGQVKNNAGGFSYQVSDWDKALRFLILGTTGGTYYVSQKKLTKQNLTALDNCLKQDGLRFVDMVVNLSQSGRAPNNDPALFALALASSQSNQVLVSGNKNKTQKVPTQAALLAMDSLPKVARTFTHLSHFITFIEEGKLRGWGRALMRAVANWYNLKPVSDLEYQIIKYGSRDGVAQKDAYRLSHPASFADLSHDEPRRILYDYIAKGKQPKEGILPKLEATLRLAKTTSEKEAVSLIVTNKLPMEAVPTELRSTEVYRAVMPTAGLEWLTRNLVNFAKHDLLANTKKSDGFVDMLVERITNEEAIKKARLHPIAILKALLMYKQGHSERGGSTWTPLSKVVDALDDAFYKSFNYVEPSGKRIMMAIDISGSMHGTQVLDMSYMSCHQGAACLAMAAAKSEKNFVSTWFNTSAGLVDISPRRRLDDNVRAIEKCGSGGTDCAAPMRFALQNRISIDTFVCFTDSETWAGHTHPQHALEEYRKSMGIQSRAINVCMAANPYTTFNSEDPLVLEVVGFDASLPALISLFAKGLEIE